MRLLLLAFGHLLSRLFVKLTITGRDNLPTGGPLIIISNHFSLFEAPIIRLHLPYDPVFVAAVELMENWFVRLLHRTFDVILVRRGRGDRQALRQGQQVLQHNGVLVIFPEGGIDPDIRTALEQGQFVSASEGKNVRGELISPRPGTAYLAVKSGAPILPLAVVGGDQIMANLRRGRRTAVSLHIGPVFGPLTLDTALTRREKRAQLHQYGDKMMHHIAALLPPKHQGPYRQPPRE